MNNELPIDIKLFLYHKEASNAPLFLLLHDQQSAENWKPISCKLEIHEALTDSLYRHVYGDTGILPIEPSIEIREVCRFNHVEKYTVTIQIFYTLEVERAAATRFNQDYTTYRWYTYNDALKLILDAPSRKALHILNESIKHSFTKPQIIDP